MSEQITKKDLNELELSIDSKIDKAVTDLSEIIANFATQVDDRFNKVETDIFKVQQDFEQIRMQNIEIRNSIDRLTNTIDGFLKRIDNYETEQVARDNQLAKLLDWARKVSEKTGIPLENL